MRIILQIISLTWFGIQTIPRRWGSSLSAVAGIAGVVAVLVGVVSIAQGFRRAMTVAGEPDTVVVMRSGADSEMMSGLSREEARIIGDSPFLMKSADNKSTLSSAELFVVINLPKRSTGTDANVPLRGVGKAAFEVRSGLRFTEGRPFETGRNEIVVGKGAALAFAGLDLGETIQVGRTTWEVVGVFEESGGIAESEIWADATVLQDAYQRGEGYQSVYAKLASPDDFDSFKDSLTTDPRLNIKALRQTEYYEEQSETVSRLITGVGFLIASLMALGAVFGALNTMYTAVSSRTVEIATLRALGFGKIPVLMSVFLESMTLALMGGCLGALVSYLFFDGYRAATMNWQTFSQVTFAFKVTPALLLQGILYALLIGAVGGLFPAFRAASLPIASALRES